MGKVDELHRIADALEAISKDAEAISKDTAVIVDTLEDIAAALGRAYPERIRPAAPIRAAGELHSSESSGAAPPMSDGELLEMVRAAAARAKGRC